MNYIWISVILVAAGLAATCTAEEPTAPGNAGNPTPGLAVLNRFVQSHCIDCHNKGTRKGELALDELLAADIEANAKIWEAVVRKLTSRQMPPKESPRPTERDFDTAIAFLGSSLDAMKSPNPGRTETFRRLNRTEYQNTIRDLLRLDVDITSLLPADESSHGFDNVTVADLSPTLLNRYVSAAQKISRLAVGSTPRSPGAEIVRIRPDITQDAHVKC